MYMYTGVDGASTISAQLVERSARQAARCLSQAATGCYGRGGPHS